MAPEQLTTIDHILVAQILSNLQSFTKVPKSITSSSSFLTFKEKMLQFLSVKWWIDQAALTQHINIFYLLMRAEVASLINLVVSWSLLSITLTCKLNDFFFLVRQINDDDDDDDDGDGTLFSGIIYHSNAWRFCWQEKVQGGVECKHNFAVFAVFDLQSEFMIIILINKNNIINNNLLCRIDCLCFWTVLFAEVCIWQCWN